MSIEPAVACFLFLEVAIDVACWAIAIDSLFIQEAGKPPWGNFASAVFASIIAIFSFALLLPA